jgi:phosphomannomutase
VLRYRLSDGSRVIVRPSGTEPKLKVYIDARADSAEDSRRAVADLEAGVRTLLEERS